MRVEAGLEPDHVAEPGDDALIEQGVADLPPAAVCAVGARSPPARSKPARSGSGPSCIRPGSLRIRDSLASRRIWPPRCEAMPAPGGQQQPRLAVRQPPVGGDEPAPVHPEVAVQDEVAGEVGEQVLAARLDRTRVCARAARSPGRGSASAGSGPRRAPSPGPSAPRRGGGRRGGSCRPRALGDGGDELARLLGEAALDQRRLEARADRRLAVDALDRELRQGAARRRPRSAA